MKETTVTPVGFSVGAPNEEALDAGAEPLIQVTLAIGAMLPIAGPDGQPIIFPVENLHFKVDKDSGNQLIQAMQQAVDQLPEQSKSDITIAKSLQGVDQLAEGIGKFRG